jgi:hypothetical protein
LKRAWDGAFHTYSSASNRKYSLGPVQHGGLSFIQLEEGKEKKTACPIYFISIISLKLHIFPGY